MKNKKIIPIALYTLIGVVIVILCAVTASILYNQTTDEFASTLSYNLARLCSDSDIELSKAELYIIENADIKSVKYSETDDGNKKFYAELRLIKPQINCGAYSGENPFEYLRKSFETLFNNKWNYVSCDIVGLCIDGKPMTDIENLNHIAECTAEAWNNGSELIQSKDFRTALADIYCPSPFADGNYSDSKNYTSAYSDFLDKYSEYFAANGIKINGEISNDTAAIRSAMEEILTPYFCSSENIKINADAKNRGSFLMSFDSLNVIQSISDAKRHIIVAESDTDASTVKKTISDTLKSDISSRPSNKIIHSEINIDIMDAVSAESNINENFCGTIRAIIEYYSDSASDVVNSMKNIQKIESSQIISGKSNGTWPVEFKRNKGDGDAVISVIKISDNGEETPVMKIYLTDGGSDIVCLGGGNYRLNIAVGANYCGAEQLFGDDGIYFKDSNIFDVASSSVPSITVEKHTEENMSIFEYILSKNNGGSCIDKSVF